MCEDTCWKWSPNFRSCQRHTVHGAGDLFAMGFVSGVKQCYLWDIISRRFRQMYCQLPWQKFIAFGLFSAINVHGGRESEYNMKVFCFWNLVYRYGKILEGSSPTVDIDKTWRMTPKWIKECDNRGFCKLFLELHMALYPSECTQQLRVLQS